MAEAISTRAQRKRGNGGTGKSPFIVPTEDEIKVGNRLRGIRSERGLSIRALAEISGLNVNTTQPDRERTYIAQCGDSPTIGAKPAGAHHRFF